MLDGPKTLLWFLNIASLRLKKPKMAPRVAKSVLGPKSDQESPKRAPRLPQGGSKSLPIQDAFKIKRLYVSLTSKLPPEAPLTQKHRISADGGMVAYLTDGCHGMAYLTD